MRGAHTGEGLGCGAGGEGLACGAALQNARLQSGMTRSCGLCTHIGEVTCTYTLLRWSHSTSAGDNLTIRSAHTLLQITIILPPT